MRYSLKETFPHTNKFNILWDWRLLINLVNLSPHYTELFKHSAGVKKVERRIPFRKQIVWDEFRTQLY